MRTEEQHKIEHILAGKTEEFAYFLDTYGQQVFTLIVRMVDSESDAEELTQDTFLKAFQHLSSFNGKSQFSTWIYRIAYNTALTALRKKNIELTADEKLWNTLSDTETDDLLDDTSENRIEKLREALDRLPADERALITFFYEEEKNRIQKEIDDLWEVGKKSPKRVNRLVEIEYILDGLEADKKIRQLNEENKALRKRLMQEGIEVSE